MQVKMPPRKDPEVTMLDNLTRMTEAVVGLTQLVSQQVNANAAQAQAQRMVAENHRGSDRADFRGQGSSGKSRKFRKKPYQRLQGRREARKQSKPQGTGPGSPGVREEVTCYRCGQQGHYAVNCRGKRVCYACKQDGHLAKDCGQANAGTTGNATLESRPTTLARAHTESGGKAVEEEGSILRKSKYTSNFLTLVLISGVTHRSFPKRVWNV